MRHKPQAGQSDEVRPQRVHVEEVRHHQGRRAKDATGHQLPGGLELTTHLYGVHDEPPDADRHPQRHEFPEPPRED